jgi:hypothetical protein
MGMTDAAVVGAMTDVEALEAECEQLLDMINKLNGQLGTARLTMGGRKLRPREWLEWRAATIEELRGVEREYRRAKLKLSKLRKV